MGPQIAFAEDHLYRSGRDYHARIFNNVGVGHKRPSSEEKMRRQVADNPILADPHATIAIDKTPSTMIDFLQQGWQEFKDKWEAYYEQNMIAREMRKLLSKMGEKSQKMAKRKTRGTSASGTSRKVAVKNIEPVLSTPKPTTEDPSSARGFPIMRTRVQKRQMEVGDFPRGPTRADEEPLRQDEWQEEGNHASRREVQHRIRPAEVLRYTREPLDIIMASRIRDLPSTSAAIPLPTKDSGVEDSDHTPPQGNDRDSDFTPSQETDCDPLIRPTEVVFAYPQPAATSAIFDTFKLHFRPLAWYKASVQMSLYFTEQEIQNGSAKWKIEQERRAKADAGKRARAEAKAHRDKM